MKPIEEINLKEMKQVLIDFNGFLTKHGKSKIKLVGDPKDLIEGFTKKIESLNEDEQSDLPESVIDFYNDIYADEVVEEEIPEPVTPIKSEEKKKGRSKKEEPKVEEVLDEEPVAQAPAKKRGRPKKEKLNVEEILDENLNVEEILAEEPVAPAPAKKNGKKRGRPKKEKPKVEEILEEETIEEEIPEEKSDGRFIPKSKGVVSKFTFSKDVLRNITKLYEESKLGKTNYNDAVIVKAFMEVGANASPKTILPYCKQNKKFDATDKYFKAEMYKLRSVCRILALWDISKENTSRIKKAIEMFFTGVPYDSDKHVVTRSTLHLIRRTFHAIYLATNGEV